MSQMPVVREEVADNTWSQLQRELRREDKTQGDFVKRNIKIIAESNPNLAKHIKILMFRKIDPPVCVLAAAIGCIYTYRAIKAECEVKELEEMYSWAKNEVMNL